MRQTRKGQGILEYVVVLTAIAVVVIAFVVLMQPNVEDTYNNAGAVVEDATGRLAELHMGQ
jgi:Flp pilus assembly pilin Flp